MAEEAQRRWDARRAAKDPTTGAAKTKDGPSENPKVDLTKDRTGTTEGGSESKKADGSGKPAGEAPGAPGGAHPKDSAGPVGSAPKVAESGRRTTRERIKERIRTSRKQRETRAEAKAQAEADREGPTDRIWMPGDRPDRPEPAAPSSPVDDYEDAVFVEPKRLPRAPEPHTQRPGTSRPTPQESDVSTRIDKPAAQPSGLAAQHRTDITFDEYLMAMVNIAIKSASHEERAEALQELLGKVIDAWREVAADLVGDHNIDSRVTNQIMDMADAAGGMKMQAQRCAQECGTAKEAAKVAAGMVARTYGRDMDAKEDAGLKYASAAAHHD